MSLFDTLFPQQGRASEGRRPDRAGRPRRGAAKREGLRHLGRGEQLERRDLLAVTVVQETPRTFFTDFSRGFDSEYASYTVKNLDSGPIDAWVKVSFPAGSKIGIGAAFGNHEDGLYYIGKLNNSEQGEAFLYYTASQNTVVEQPYSFEVFNGKPGAGGIPVPISSPPPFSYTSIVDTLAAELNKVSSVNISPAAPSIGDILTLQVGGKLGSGANSVFFAPANLKSWQPDVFELRAATHTISGISGLTPNRLFYDGLPSGGSNEKTFNSVYEFLVTGPLGTSTQVSPTQWTQDGDQKFKHHKPDATPLPVIPKISYDISVSKTDDNGTYESPGTTTFTVTIQNTGKATANNVRITDVLPVGQIAQTSQWTVSYVNGATSGPVGPGLDGLGSAGTGDIVNRTVNLPGKVDDIVATVVITINAIVLPDVTGPITNTVIVTAPDETQKSASVTIYDIALSLSKDDKKTTYTPGGTTTYTIVLANTGTVPLNGIILDDELPAQIDKTSTWTVTYADGATSGAGPNGLGDAGAGDIVTRTVNLPGKVDGKVATVTITINAKIFSSATGQMVNTISATLPTGGPPIKASDSNSPVPDERLTLTKDNKQATYIPGTTTTYTIVLSNIGLSDVNNIIVSDLLPKQLDPLTTTWFATYSNASGTLPTDPTTGDILGTVTTIKGSVGVVTITINGVILSTATGDMVNTVTAKNSISLSSTDRDTAAPEVDLAVTKTRTSPLPVVAGESVTYTITVTSNGPSAITTFSGVDVTVPALLSPSYTVNNGTYNPDTKTWTAGAGDFFTPGEVITFTLTGIVPADATGTLTNTATATPPVKDPNPQNNTSTATDTIVVKPVLSITKTASEKFVKAGEGGYKFQLTVKNTGPSDALGVSVVDTLPAGFTATAFSPSAGVLPLAPTAGPFTWTIGTLAAGATTILDITYAVAASVPESTQTNTAVVKIAEEVKDTAKVSVDVEGVVPPLSINPGLVVGSDDGCNGPPWVRVLDPNSGVERSRFLAYDARFRGSVRVATGDVTGDGVAEIITAPSRNLVGEVRVFQRNLLGAAQQNGLSEWTELTQYRTLAFGPRYRGGVEVAVADIDGIPGNEIVTAMSIQSGMVNVFKVTPGAIDPVANSPFRSFRGAPAGFNNGVMISAGDYINGGILGGPAEIAVGTNSGTRALVRIFDVSGTPTVVRSFNPFANGFRGGVTLSTADYDGNGALDLIVGAGLNGGSRVEVWNPATPSRIAQTSVFSSLAKPNARVFAVFGTAADGFLGPDSTLYGVQGLNGGRGSKGVWKVLSGKAESLVNSQTSLPPLRIAPIGLPLAPIAPRLG